METREGLNCLLNWPLRRFSLFTPEEPVEPLRISVYPLHRRLPKTYVAPQLYRAEGPVFVHEIYLFYQLYLESVGIFEERYSDII